MPTRTIRIDGAEWAVYPSGRVTQYDRDEFALIFVRGSGDGRTVRVTRYSPVGTRSREQSLWELSEDELRGLHAMSQPANTSPEAGYLR